MTTISDAELVETTFNVYDRKRRFRDNYPTIEEAISMCRPGDSVVERHRYEAFEDGRLLTRARLTHKANPDRVLRS